jgi:predicted RNA methylase
LIRFCGIVIRLIIDFLAVRRELVPLLRARFLQNDRVLVFSEALNTENKISRPFSKVLRIIERKFLGEDEDYGHAGSRVGQKHARMPQVFASHRHISKSTQIHVCGMIRAENGYISGIIAQIPQPCKSLNPQHPPAKNALYT